MNNLPYFSFFLVDDNSSNNVSLTGVGCMGWREGSREGVVLLLILQFYSSHIVFLICV